MPAKVIDASALAALVFAEPTSEEISARLGDSVLVAPTLVRYEVGSVALKKLRRYPRQREAILTALGLVSQMAIREVEVPTDEVVRLAEQVRVTVYDASYVWLARSIRAELVTLDEDLDRAARSQARP
jgi:predicted nucleic acid-binding protein